MGIAECAAPIENLKFENAIVLIMGALSIISAILYLYKIRILEKENNCLNTELNNISKGHKILQDELNTFMFNTAPIPNECFAMPSGEISEVPDETQQPTKTIKIVVKKEKPKEEKPLITKPAFNRIARDKGYKDTKLFISDIHQYKEVGKLPSGLKITKLMVSRANYAQEQGWAN
jgi:hypothetical protein